MSYSWDKIGRRIQEERKKMPSKLPKTGKRKASYVTQAELAEMICNELGIADTGTYRKKVLAWEDGKPADLEELLALCNIFRCDIHYLLCETDTRYYVNINDVEKYGLTAEALMKLQEYSHSFFLVPFYVSHDLEPLSKLICNQSAFMAFLHLCETYMFSYTPDRQDLKIYDDGSDNPRLPAEFSLDDAELSIVREQAFIKKLRELFEGDKKIIEKVKN